MIAQILNSHTHRVANTLISVLTVPIIASKSARHISWLCKKAVVLYKKVYEKGKEYLMKFKGYCRHLRVKYSAKVRKHRTLLRMAQIKSQNFFETVNIEEAFKKIGAQVYHTLLNDGMTKEEIIKRGGLRKMDDVMQFRLKLADQSLWWFWGNINLRKFYLERLEEYSWFELELGLWGITTDFITQSKIWKFFRKILGFKECEPKRTLPKYSDVFE
jgi:hypothetical protein